MGFVFIRCFDCIACFHINHEKCISSYRVLNIFTLASLMATTLWIIAIQALLVSVGKRQGIIREELFITMCKLFQLILSMSEFTQCTFSLFVLAER